MTPRPKHDVPKRFIEIIEDAMDKVGISQRQAAIGAEMDPATLCRILGGDQGLPTNDVILRLARVLEIEPPEELLYAGGRIPDDPLVVPLLRATSNLSKKELREIIRLAKERARGRQSGKRQKK